jgi:uncharacterized protein
MDVTVASTPERTRNRIVPELGVGAIGGIIGGMLGGGSGVFYVPALEKITTLSRHTLHGTAGAANIGVMAVGAGTFAVAGGAFDLHAGLGMIVGATLGAAFGAKLILRLPQRLLRWLFVGVLLLTCLKLGLDVAGLGGHSGALVSPSLVANPWFTAPVSILVGFVIGAWAAGMGLGGGLLAVPALMVLFNVELHSAVGTSLLMFLPNAVVGTIVHARQGTADMRLAAILNAGALPGAIVGALVALALNRTVLSAVFAAFCLLVAVRELYRMYKDSGDEAKDELIDVVTMGD